jgi:hypothetical protein
MGLVFLGGGKSQDHRGSAGIPSPPHCTAKTALAKAANRALASMRHSPRLDAEAKPRVSPDEDAT